MNAENIRRKEPLDGILPIPRPRLLRDALHLLFDSGVQSPTQFQEELALNSADIAELAAVQNSLFNAPVVKFNLSSRTANDNE